MLDQAIQDMQRKWAESGLPTNLYKDADGPEARRRGIEARDRFYPKPDLPTGKIEHTTIQGPRGGIPIRIVHPVHGTASATVVYFHGGGWIIGDLDSHEAHAIRIANQCGAIVVHVGYRLAPEDPWPAGVDDAIAATEWSAANLTRLGNNGTKLAVAGDSAGGNLAAITAVHCRDAGLRLAAQLLLYPATDLSARGDADVYVPYLGANFRDKVRDPRVSPFFTPTLSGVAPAIIGTGVYDFLYQDNLAYAAKLRADDVPLVLRDYPNLNHGFWSSVSISEASRNAADELCADLRSVLYS